jgi:two-component system repressor protein LuxO
MLPAQVLRQQRPVAPRQPAPPVAAPSVAAPPRLSESPEHVVSDLDELVAELSQPVIEARLDAEAPFTAEPLRLMEPSRVAAPFAMAPAPLPLPVAPPPAAVAVEPEIVPLAVMERNLIVAALAHTGGDVPRAAALLQVNPSTIYRKLQAWRGETPTGVRENAP